MKRRKIHFTWEILDKLLKLNGRKIYKTEMTDDGIAFDVYGGKMEHVEGSMNEQERISTIS